ncbi:Ankyrin repeat domain-containing protein 45, partial [Fasciolopsis buskii]
PRSQRAKGSAVESLVPLSTVIHAGQEEDVHNRIAALEFSPDELLKEMQQTDDFQKTNLEMLAILNSVENIEKTIRAGFNVNSRGKGGYTLLHFANMWNRPDVVRYLYNNHAELFPMNKASETPHSLSVKYENTEANEMMLWAECRQDFYALLQQSRAILNVTDKSEYTKEERKMLETACNDGEIWLERNREASLSALRTKKEHIELIVEPFFRSKSPKNVN